MNTIPIPTISGNKTVSDIFTNTTFIYMLIFLAIYSVIYIVLGVFNRGSAESSGSLRIVRIIDILVIVLAVIYVAVTYAGASVDDFSTSLSMTLQKFKTFADNPFSIFSVMIFLLILYTVIYFIKIPMTSELKPASIMLVETLTILLFVILLIFDFFKYLFKIDIFDFMLDSLIQKLDKTPVSSSPPPRPLKQTGVCPKSTDTPETPFDEVFNIRNNLYTYDDAKEVCSIYGAKLATYDQIETAYNNGAEWCNYGWSEGQLALFPTQKCTWEALQQKKPSREVANNACGRPGINGGFIRNPNIRFGVNCYGKKPVATDCDKDRMKANVESKLAESPTDVKLKEKAELWKKNADKFLVVNSFNKDKWSNNA